MDTIALITGANKGIGKETARRLAGQGIKVIIGSRNLGQGQAAAQSLAIADQQVDVIQLDVTAESSVRAAARYIEQKYGKLDILINNAGISLSREPEAAFDIKTFSQTYDTNVFGIVRVTGVMLPLLKKSSHARIVNLSSTLASLMIASAEAHTPALPAYNSSKTAVNALTVVYAKLLKSDNIKINAADPGYTATDLNNHAGVRTVEQAATIIVKLATLPADGPTGGYFDEDRQLPW